MSATSAMTFSFFTSIKAKSSDGVTGLEKLLRVFVRVMYVMYALTIITLLLSCLSIFSYSSSNL